VPGHSSPPLQQKASFIVKFPLVEDPLSSPAFGDGPPFRLGIEEELFLVDRHAHAILRCTDDLLARHGRHRHGGVITGEMCDGVIALVTPFCATADAAVAILRDLRRAVRSYDAAALLGAGVHPAAPFGDVCHRGGRHYAAVDADVRGVLRQSACCGLHVHVGMPDAETAIIAYNGMRKWVPLLLALAANSPFWHGRDSGLASSRTVRCHSVPRTGLPRAFRDWADYRDTMRELIHVGDLDGVGSLWWDVRPHPTLGTLEVRVLDAQASLEDVRGLVALVHCLTYHEAITADARHASKELLDEASFHAVRDGLDARLSIGGPVQHVQALARRAVDLAAGYAHTLDCTESLAALERLLASGNGADRQRRAFARGGIPAVLAGLVEETGATAVSATQTALRAAG
jgi:carboxylate-amine ligase